MNGPGPIVLLGGGGLGPWAWGRVTPLLVQQGLAVTTPQLRTTGDDATPPADITLSDWIDDLFDEMSRLDDATLVAHSFAGYVAAGAIERIAPRLRSLIFLDAVLPEPGESWFEVMGHDVEAHMRSIAVDGGTPWLTRAELDQMYPGNGISDADLAWMHAHVTAQPIETYTQPAIDKPLETLAAGTRLQYVRCLRTDPPAASITVGIPGWTVTTIDSSHWPMITAPEETAQRIIELVRST